MAQNVMRALMANYKGNFISVAHISEQSHGEAKDRLALFIHSLEGIRGAFRIRINRNHKIAI